MNIFFTHTHKFGRFNNEVYSSGGLAQEALNRYSNYGSKLRIGARIVDITEGKALNLSRISDPKVEFRAIKYNFEMFTIIKQLVLSSDYIIARLPSIFGVVACLYAKLYKKRLLVEVVGNGYEALYYHSLFGKCVAGIFHFANKVSIKNADYVSYITLDYLQKIYPANGIIGNGLANVVINDFEFIDDKILEKRFSKIALGKTIKLGMVANYEVKYKNHVQAIKMFAKVSEIYPSITLELVGGGDFVELQKKVVNAGIENQVKFIGTIPNENILEWYDQIDIYLQPSKTEAHGRSVIEAMSRACTVITSDVGGMRENIDKDFRFNLNNDNAFLNIVLNAVKCKNIRVSQAVINYNRSKKFTKTNIDRKRRDFFQLYFGKSYGE